MTTIQYLNQIDRCNRIINNKLSEVWQLRQLATSISVTMKDDNVQTFGDKDRLGASVSKIIDKENELSEYVNDYLETRYDIIHQIGTMDSLIEYQVLFSRYVELKNYDDIAKDLNYSDRQIFRIHRKAISNFENKYGYLYLNK